MKYTIASLLIISSALAVPFAESSVEGALVPRAFGRNNNGNTGKVAGGNANGGNANAGAAGAGVATTSSAAPAKATGTASAAPKPTNFNTGSFTQAQAGTETLVQAASNWAKDTAVVSNFLNLAPGLTGQDFVNQAKIAYDAEVDELTHKAVLDKSTSVTSQQTVTAGNNSLVTEGAFQKVVDVLLQMVQTGDSIAQSATDSINANRCVNVLPAIDAYLAAAGTNSLATRPTVCDSTGVKTN